MNITETIYDQLRVARELIAEKDTQIKRLETELKELQDSYRKICEVHK
jgi:hypothetical protein